MAENEEIRQRDIGQGADAQPVVVEDQVGRRLLGETVAHRGQVGQAEGHAEEKQVQGHEPEEPVRVEEERPLGGASVLAVEDQRHVEPGEDVEALDRHLPTSTEIQGNPAARRDQDPPHVREQD